MLRIFQMPLVFSRYGDFFLKLLFLSLSDVYHVFRVYFSDRFYPISEL